MLLDFDFDMLKNAVLLHERYDVESANSTIQVPIMPLKGLLFAFAFQHCPYYSSVDRKFPSHAASLQIEIKIMCAVTACSNRSLPYHSSLVTNYVKRFAVTPICNILFIAHLGTAQHMQGVYLPYASFHRLR